MPLTDIEVKTAKYGQGKSKRFDGQGLFLWLKPSGTKLWRWKYRIGRKEKQLALGVYPAVSLRAARDARDDARKLLQRGVDPSLRRRADKVATGTTFDDVAAEYLKLHEHEQSATTQRKAKQQLRDFISKQVGDRPIGEITSHEILRALKRIESTGSLETCRKVKELCGRIFRHAVATGRADRDPTQDLRGLLKAPVSTNRPAITDPRKVAELMRAIAGYEAQPSTMYALRLAPHVFLRPGELRAGRWAEIDWEAATWRVPGERMKMKRPHLVPLSKQAITILRGAQALTGDGELMFPAIGPKRRPISENTLNAALRRLGYSTATEMCAHGFRAMASSLLHERGHDHAVIELQLAHKDPNKVAAAYNRSERLADRVKLMQAWSDYLDTLEAGGKVVAMKSARR
jgi:integrase